MVTKVEQCSQDGLVPRVKAGEDRVLGDQLVSLVCLNHRRYPLQQMNVLDQQVRVGVTVEVGLENAFDSGIRKK